MYSMSESRLASAVSSGRLIYVIGASGSGKDSLITYARRALKADHLCCFAHRYITRAANSGGENHVELSELEFDQRVKQGFFSMWWKSHGHKYGIGLEIDHWLEKGMTVIVNGSRAYLSEAIKRYPSLQPLLIDVDPEVLRDRLIKRGREASHEIDQRVDRAMQYTNLDHPLISRIENNRSLEEAGDKILRFIAGK